MKRLILSFLFLVSFLRGADLLAQDTLRLNYRVQADSVCGTTSVTLVARGGTPPYRYSFNYSPFFSDSVFHNIVGNISTYNLKVIDAEGRQATTFYGNSFRQSYPAFTTIFRQTNCSSATGTLAVNIFGDTSGMPFRFRIDNTTSADFYTTSWQVPNISRGLHNIALIFGNGCANERWVNLEDSTVAPYHQYIYNSACGNAADLRINTFPQRTYTYILDNLPATTNPNWSNVLPGTHVITVSESTGCTKTDTFQLRTTGLTVGLTSLPTSCRDSLGLFRIVPTGGRAPFSFSVNGSVTTSIDTVRLTTGLHSFNVVDASGCRFIGSLFAHRLTDSVRFSYLFQPNSCGATVGTLTFNFPDTLYRPLSMSLDSAALTTNFTFQNVNTGMHTVRFITFGGCEQVVKISLNTSLPIQVALRDTCPNLRGFGGLYANAYSGRFPYTYMWSNGATTAVLQNIPIGLYTVTVTDANGCKTTGSHLLTSCVWSGDTDTSGVVDNRDVLNIGLAFGETGARRCYDSMPNSPICTNWFAQKAADWSKQTPDKTNYKHIDTNGDGIINNSDTLAIVRNWNLVHQSIEPQTPVFAAQSVVPPIYVQTSNVREGDWASFPIMLGEAGTQAENVYGLAFSIKYPPSVIEPNSMRLVVTQSWLGAPSTLLNVSKDEFDNVFHIGLVKTNKLNTTGAGQIATLIFKLKAGTKGSDLQFGVYNDFLINNAAQQLPSVGQVTTVKILTETDELIWANQISIYPNPTTDKVFIDAQNIDIQSIMVFDMLGKQIQNVQKLALTAPLSMPTVGTYFLKIDTNKGVVMKKVVKM
jgi:Secretion system C-terminal sorting domain